MKNLFTTLILLLATLTLSFGQDKTAKLEIQFGDVIAMHNVNIAYDGTYYYTVNGGNETVGAINKYTESGDLVASYDIGIDMRSISFNPKDGKFYVGSHDLNVYKIINVEKGTYRIMFDDFSKYDQASPQLDPTGDFMYVLEFGKIHKYSFPKGKLEATFYDIKSGKENYGGDGAIAIDKRNIYTWNAYEKELYVYDLEGNYETTIKLNNNADGGFSLSYANNMIFVSKDGDGGRGTWYGYSITDAPKDESGKGGRKKKDDKPNLALQFDDEIPMHNFDIVFDGRHYYTINGGNSTVGAINKYTENGDIVASYKISLDMRSIMYHPKDKTFYVSTYSTNIYKINSFETDDYELVYKGIYEYDQASPTLDPKGKYMYILEYNTLRKYDFSTGKVVETFKNIKSGRGNYGGDGAVAITKDNIYTWDAANREVYVYDLDGNYEKSFKLNEGDCGFSLSFTNDLLFVSKDGNGYIGTWYGFTLNDDKKSRWKKKEKEKKSDEKKGRLPEETEN